MEKRLKEASELIEKLFSLPYFLFVISLTTFADVYLLAAHGVTLRSANAVWASSYTSAMPIVSFLGCAGFFYAAFIPGLRFSIEYARTFFPNGIYRKKDRGWILHQDLRNYAVANSNSLAYQFYEKSVAEKAGDRYLSGLCLSLIAITIAGYFLSAETNQALIQVIFARFDELRIFPKIILTFAATPFLFFVFICAFRSNVDYDHYIYLPDFENWPDKRKDLAAG